MVLEAGIDRICYEVETGIEAGKVSTFTTHLMAMDNAEQRMTWLKGQDTIAQAKDTIVGAVWVDKNHWCGLCICKARQTYTVMDPRNDEATIGKVETLFRDVLYPLLEHEKRWKRDVNHDYQQLNSTSCGILVLAFIESYLFQEYNAPSDSDYLRYRYMLKLLLA
ncbi:hypothetical protein PI124_g17682 [Phytophthora idaei]|nr:hypothetical protein PI125_g18568 [Phytophthora idaei]KAG3137565.1 hypothetical protein PI126_g17341 [Phytophthora idaei]KAG3237329.1 hypothetical protein PI124_g17682 [Phytophthora idaei]